MAARGPYYQWIRKVQLRIAQTLLPRIRRGIESRTLRQSLQAYERAQDGVAVLGVPHYWARFYHDGRGSFGPRRTKYLVYFADPLRDDPRLAGQYPIRFSEWRPLTKEEFAFAIAMNKAQGGGLSGPFVRISRFSGPTRPNRFFEDTNPSADARKIVPDAFSALVKKELGKDFKRTEKISARVKIRP